MIINGISSSNDCKDRSIFVNSSISTGSLVNGNIAANVICSIDSFSQVLFSQNGSILGSVGSHILCDVSANILGGIDLHLGVDTLICSLVLLGSGVHRDILGRVGSNVLRHIGGRICLWVSNGLLLWSCSSVVSGILTLVSSDVGGHIGSHVCASVGSFVQFDV